MTYSTGTYIGPSPELQGKTAIIRDHEEHDSLCMVQFDDLNLSYRYTHGWLAYRRENWDIQIPPITVDASSWTGRTWDNRLLVRVKPSDICVLWIRRDHGLSGWDRSKMWGFSMGLSLVYSAYGLRLFWNDWEHFFPFRGADRCQ